MRWNLVKMCVHENERPVNLGSFAPSPTHRVSCECECAVTRWSGNKALGMKRQGMKRSPRNRETQAALEKTSSRGRMNLTYLREDVKVQLKKGEIIINRCWRRNQNKLICNLRGEEKKRLNTPWVYWMQYNTDACVWDEVRREIYTLENGSRQFCLHICADRSTRCITRKQVKEHFSHFINTSTCRWVKTIHAEQALMKSDRYLHMIDDTEDNVTRFSFFLQQGMRWDEISLSQFK